jgi:geranylgeranyl reductase family protein
LGSGFDVIVAGGSIAGLAFAAEAAKRGLHVLVVEEHDEIGEPEKCDGLVSLRLLRRYGFLPKPNVVQDQIASGVMHSPASRTLEVNATSLDVVVLDRSEYDKQVAGMAENRGAEIRTGLRASLIGEHEAEEGGVTVKVGTDTLSARYLVDATGPTSSPKVGIIPAAKFEIKAEWIREHVVEVFLDAEKYPGFFAWVIPFGPNLAKVGAAGRGINPYTALNSFLSSREHVVLRKISAPLYVGGPIGSFVFGRRIWVGESAGLVKPTTAGGIATSVAGAVMAAKWISDAIVQNDEKLIENYQSDWDSRFGKEMKSMQRLRGVFEKLSNKELDALIGVFSAPRLLAKLSQSDFDFHGTALLGALGVRGLLQMAKVVASAEARALIIGS